MAARGAGLLEARVTSDQQVAARPATSQLSMPGSLAPLLLLVVVTAGQLPPSTLRHGGLEVPTYLARVPSLG